LRHCVGMSLLPSSLYISIQVLTPVLLRGGGRGGVRRSSHNTILHTSVKERPDVGGTEKQPIHQGLRRGAGGMR
jgi:hypothetical protein